MVKQNVVSMVAEVLLIIGGLNWALTAFGYNLVNMLFGSIQILEQAVYVIVGMAALFAIYEMVMKK